MIRHELLASNLRFYLDESDNPFAPYDAICTLVWEAPHIVWIKGMHGKFPTSFLRQLIAWCREHKVELVKAHRALGRRLPFGREVGDHVEIVVANCP